MDSSLKSKNEANIEAKQLLFIKIAELSWAELNCLVDKSDTIEYDALINSKKGLHRAPYYRDLLDL